MTTPKFKHDCTGCHYLGESEGLDLYFCKSGTPGDKFHTVIARYGDEGCEYSSGLIFAYRDNSPLMEAVNRAIKLGLMTAADYKQQTGKEWAHNK